VSKGESIEKRPAVINDRSEVGHWEMDTLLSRRPSASGVLVLTERVTRQELTFRIPDHTAPTIVGCVDRLEYKYGERFKEMFKSITIDNGSEFADCPGIERSIFGWQRTKCYYCHPYSSYERGSNEKQNQMLRRRFPKGTDFDLVTDEAVQSVTDWLNRYPRKLLDWGNSQTLFDRAFAELAIRS
jgi:IS30 family transposase